MGKQKKYGGWLCVEQSKSEWLFTSLPIRQIEKDTETGEVYSNWHPSSNNYNDCQELDEGTIKKLIGRVLTWEDEPVKVDSMIKCSCYTCKGKGCTTCGGTGEAPMHDLVHRSHIYTEEEKEAAKDICDVPIIEYLSKREIFSAFAMQGILSGCRFESGDKAIYDISKVSVSIADSLIEELNKKVE